MKIAVYNYREFDEGQYFEKFSQHYCVEIIKIYDSPNKENAVLAKGCNAGSRIGYITYDHLIRLSCFQVNMIITNISC